jgi:hypothetical protein
MEEVIIVASFSCNKRRRRFNNILLKILKEREKRGKVR